MAAATPRVSIVGADESDEIGRVPYKSVMQFHAEAARNALADAGIGMDEVDGVFTSGMSPVAVGSPFLRRRGRQK